MEKPDQEAPLPERLPHLELQWHMSTGILAIAGHVPNNAVGLDMARRLVDEFEWRVRMDRENERRVALAAGGTSVLPHLIGRG